jgi:acyl carrier protein|tara:strand:+ start:23 stop:253 length:231 start_codon:yes stop_codon:yes gene_type:complete
MSGFDEFREQFLMAVDFEDPPEIDESTKIASLEQFDSIAMLGTIVMFEIEFDKTITAEAILACDTIYELYLISEQA